MFNFIGDQVWVNTLPGKPSLDMITGALFVCGVVFLLARLIWRRDRVAGVLLLLVPFLLLPSTLSLAFPNENPSVVRAGRGHPGGLSHCGLSAVAAVEAPAGRVARPDRPLAEQRQPGGADRRRGADQ